MFNNFHLKEEILKVFDTIRAFRLHENVTRELFGYLHKCESFYEQCVFYKKHVQNNVRNFFKVKNLKYWGTKKVMHQFLFTYVYYVFF